MADAELVARLKRGVAEWNTWRERDNLRIPLDLEKANLYLQRLDGAMVRGIMLRVGRKANVKPGVQELAGHTDLATTGRYMHLSSSAMRM